MNIKIDDPLLTQNTSQHHGFIIYGLVALFVHLMLGAALAYGFLFPKNIIGEDGNNTIKAVMIDLSQTAAPEQNLAETTPEIKGDENSKIIDDKPIKETPPEPIIEPDTDKKPQEVIEQDKIAPTPDKVVETPAEKPVDKPVIKEVVTTKPPQKPKPRKPPEQRASHQQVRQEVVSHNTANSAVAPSISDNQKHSASPSPISQNKPEYPRRALDMRIEGYVVVKFDVNSSGRVENIRFEESIPNNIFNRSVTNAMKTWKYKPIAAKDITYKIIFNRNQTVSFNGG